MTLALTNLITDLQGNMEVTGAYLEDPITIIKKYGISEEEKELMLSKDIAGLNSIGLHKKSIYVALSGAHSQTCTCHHIPFCGTKDEEKLLAFLQYPFFKNSCLASIYHKAFSHEYDSILEFKAELEKFLRGI